MSATFKLYECTEPCRSCPYRTDSPPAMWDRAAFARLLETEQDRNPLGGTVYRCHKQNGSVCVGWLMDQDRRGFPSIALRLSLSKHNVTRGYLDRLACPVPLYGSVEEMVAANFPDLIETWEPCDFTCDRCGAGPVSYRETEDGEKQRCAACGSEWWAQ